MAWNTTNAWHLIQRNWWKKAPINRQTILSFSDLWGAVFHPQRPDIRYSTHPKWLDKHAASEWLLQITWERQAQIDSESRSAGNSRVTATQYQTLNPRCIVPRGWWDISGEPLALRSAVKHWGTSTSHEREQKNSQHTNNTCHPCA